MSPERKYKRLRAAIENDGWDIIDTKVNRNDWPNRLKNCPGWLLTSRRPPLAFSLTLETHSNRVVAPQSWTAMNCLSLGPNFASELPEFVEGLSIRRSETEGSCVGTFTIMGVAVGDTATEVENILGKPTNVKSYDLGHSEGFDWDRVQRVYHETTVTYYDDDGELRVCMIVGPQLELQNQPYLFSGEPITEEHEIFSEKTRHMYSDPKYYLSKDRWNHFCWDLGALRVDGEGLLCEFRLGRDDWIGVELSR